VPGAPAPPEASGTGLASDIKRYFTAPLHWDRGEWAWFGGALVAIGAAHHYDTQVRTHFVKTLGPSMTTNSKDVQDALPAAAVFVATWGYANLIGDTNGRGEAWAMLEAAGLGSVTGYALKYAVGREGPDRTSNPNQWRKSGGNSFPSVHTTGAFAVARCSRSQGAMTIGGCGACWDMAWAPPPATSASSTTRTGCPTPSRGGARNRQRPLRHEPQGSEG